MEGCGCCWESSGTLSQDAQVRREERAGGGCRYARALSAKLAAIESAMLAPNGQLSMYPWKDTPEKIPLAVRHVRSFLLSHRPA